MKILPITSGVGFLKAKPLMRSWIMLLLFATPLAVFMPFNVSVATESTESADPVALKKQDATPSAKSPSDRAIRAAIELAHKSEKELTYLEVVLAACKIYEPGLDTAKIENMLQGLAQKAQESAAKESNPYRKIQALNKVVYQDAGMRADQEAGKSLVSGEGSLQASLLHRVLERRKGICLGLVTVYMVVAEKAGLPIFSVHSPCHIFCRYEDGRKKINIECTAKGAFVKNNHILRQSHAKKICLNEKEYFRRTTKREVLADQLNNLAYDLAYRKKGPAPLTHPQLAELMDLAVKLRPNSFEILDTAALVHLKNNNPVKALAICDQSIMLAKKYGAPPEVFVELMKRNSDCALAIQKMKKEKNSHSLK